MSELNLPERTTNEVFQDHLNIRAGGHDNIELDIDRNYDDNAVILTNYGIFNGKDGVRKCAGILRNQVPSTDYEYSLVLVHDDVAYLEWKADNVDDGADTFVIRNGKIVVQTIRYTPRPIK